MLGSLNLPTKVYIFLALKCSHEHLWFLWCCWCVVLICIGGSSLHLHRVTRCLNSRKSWTSRQFTASRLAVRGRQWHWHFQCCHQEGHGTGLLHTSLRKLANPFFLASRYSGANLTHRCKSRPFTWQSSGFNRSNRNTELGGRMVRIEENPWEFIGAHWSWLQASAKSTQSTHVSLSTPWGLDCRTTDLFKTKVDRRSLQQCSMTLSLSLKLGRHYRHWCQFLLQNLPKGSWEHNS